MAYVLTKLFLTTHSNLPYTYSSSIYIYTSSKLNHTQQYHSLKITELNLLSLIRKITKIIMARHLASVFAKQILRRSTNKASSTSSNVPKGCIAVYIGETEKKRFVVPVSYLNQPAFQDLLSKAEEQFGFNHPMGGLTIPCTEETFINVTFSLSR
ncbi:auxin-responsive protein SAUR20-like [Mercurialis annua]|uniref:auxin-responsive protein SAUR20-like n=1 Tax=Mercurialis annua TaxID=3986 RepID=UPI00216086C0|nr:auxin-responsive protein SAUR20-like [Mercurialis annua]